MTPELKAQLEGCRTLPTPPGVATQIVQLANDPEADMNRISQVLAMDPAITTKILRIANSPMYAQQRKTENLRQAIVVLDLNATLSLALACSFSLLKDWQQDHTQSGLDYPLFWRRQLLSATVTRVLATTLGVREAEELFLAALIQDVGMIALDRVVPDLYAGLEIQVHEEDLVAEEIKRLGSNHAEIGGYLLEQWHFPERIQQSVLLSHNPDSLPSDHEYGLFARCVALSSLIAEVFLSDQGDRPFEALAAAAQKYVHMDRDRLAEVLEEVGTMIPEAEGVFETKFLVNQSSEVILDDAKEALMLRSLQALQQVNTLQHTADSLVHQTQELKESVRRDALTGLYNRRYLDEFLGAAFADSATSEKPLSIAFADLDKFKKGNDTYSHQVGDQILETTANILKASVRSDDIVARYGREEFILVLPGTDFALVKVICERIVKAFQDTQHAVGGDEDLVVTISMGMATHGGKHTFESVEEFVRAADKALYTAKLQGRNRSVPFDLSSMRKVAQIG
jgi:diguanylate cyclase (GGDEF)-like protein